MNCLEMHFEDAYDIIFDRLLHAWQNQPQSLYVEYGIDCLEIHVDVTQAHSTMIDSQNIINRDQ